MYLHHALAVTALALTGGASAMPQAEQRPSACDAPVNAFGYTATNGPLTWHKTAGFEQCSKGVYQSPIDVPAAPGNPGPVPPPRLDYDGGRTQGSLAHRGDAAEVTGAVGTLKVDGAEYKLLNFHFHTPSEHRLEGEHFPAEMHMVHRAADNRTAVLGFPLQLSPDGATTALVRDALRPLGRLSPGQCAPTGAIDLGEIARRVKAGRFYNYRGSLTTPPCSEGIQWFVQRQPLALDVPTYNTLKAAVKYNSRIIQNTPGQPNAIALGCPA